MTAHLSVEQVLSLHQSLVGHLSEAGVRDVRALESAVSRPTATFDGADLYASLDAKAAALVSGLILGAPFLERNRETAIVAGECFLIANGASLVATDKDLDVVATSVGSAEMSVEALTVWFRQRLRVPR
jgi:death-on-curing protein